MARLIPTLFAALLSLPLMAQTPAPTTQPATQPSGAKVFRLTIHPMAVSDQPLQYPLLPPVDKLLPGNAALDYYPALQMAQEGGKKYRELSRLPWDQFRQPASLEQVEQLLTSLNNDPNTSDLLRLLERGSHRVNCDWQMSDPQDVAVAMEVLSSTHTVCELLNLLARERLAHGKFDEALKPMQTTVAMGRHYARVPKIIHQIVGISYCEFALDRVSEWVQQPTSPNLYWSLANLPTPLIDMRDAIARERDIKFAQFPALRQLEEGKLDQAGLQALQRDFNTYFHSIEGTTQPAQPIDHGAQLTNPALLDKARAYLRQSGMSDKQVASLDPQLAVARYQVLLWRHWIDEQIKWTALPYWQARPQLVAGDQKRQAMLHAGEGMPLFELSLWFNKMMLNQTRPDRLVAALRCVEMVRHYAALHEGRVPTTLAEVKDLPEPIDPMYGRPFDYRATGPDTAVIDSPTPEGSSEAQFTLRVEITVVK